MCITTNMWIPICKCREGVLHSRRPFLSRSFPSNNFLKFQIFSAVTVPPLNLFHPSTALVLPKYQFTSLSTLGWCLTMSSGGSVPEQFNTDIVAMIQKLKVVIMSLYFLLFPPVGESMAAIVPQ